MGSSVCRSTVYTLVPSKNSQILASVVEKNCGATTDYSTLVFIEKKIPLYKNDLIFSLRGKPEKSKIMLEWISESKLVIHIQPYEKIYAFRPLWGEINIVLKRDLSMPRPKKETQ